MAVILFIPLFSPHCVIFASFLNVQLGDFILMLILLEQNFIAGNSRQFFIWHF